MTDTGIIREIDELGRIVVPKSLRKKMNINCGDPLEIYVNDGCIILKKSPCSCHFCSSKEELVDFKDKKICKSCLEEIKGL